MLVGTILLLVIGCKVLDFRKKDRHLDCFKAKDNIIYHKDQPLARLQAMTFSLDGGELVREMNFELLDKQDQEVITNMIYFLHQTHEDDEIEVEINIDKNSESLL